jgi:hypothetical protein
MKGIFNQRELSMVMRSADSATTSLVVGFSSSVSNFCRTLLGEDIREVVTAKGRIIYKEYGDV